MNLPFILIGLLLVFDTLLIMPRSNLNMGVIMPSLLGIPFLIYGLLYTELNLWFAYGIGMIIKFFIVFCYIAFLIMILVCVILMERALKSPVRADADAVIVLGASVHGDKISPVLKGRLDLAIEYFDNNPETLILVSGGKGNNEKCAEAHAMKKYLLEHGIPDNKIAVENKSHSTLENFTFSKEILDGIFLQGYTAVFVTSSFHVYRSRKAALAAGMDIFGVGFRSPLYIMPNHCIRESMAILRYAILGIR